MCDERCDPFVFLFVGVDWWRSGGRMVWPKDTGRQVQLSEAVGFSGDWASQASGHGVFDRRRFLCGGGWCVAVVEQVQGDDAGKVW